MSGLLPCPWCGREMVGEPVVVEGSTFRWRIVQGCCTDGPEVRHDTLAKDQAAAEVESRAKAVAAWNERALSPSLAGQLDALADQLDIARQSAFADCLPMIAKAIAAELRALGGADSRDAARYRWLRDRLLCADFHYSEPPVCALVFEIPETMRVSANLDSTIDAAMSPPAGKENGDGN